MKKQYRAAAAVLAAAIVFSGCSLKDVAERFVGKQTAESSVITGGSIEVDSYNPQECISLGEYKGIEVDCTVTDEELQANIDSLLASGTTYKHIKKGTVAKGMDINIDYVGRVNGKKFDRGSAEDQMLEVGNSGYIDGFDDGLVGMEVGEKKDLKLKFPDDYSQNKKLAGKDVVFTVKVNYIAKEKKPKLTDKFVSENSDYKTVDEFKKGTKQEMQEQKKANAASTAFTKVLQSSKLLDNVPESLLEAEKLQVKTFTESQVTAYGVDLETYLDQVGMTEEQYDARLETYAQDNTLMLLVMEAIAQKENLTCTEEERAAAIKKTTESAGFSEEDYRSQYKSYYGDAFSFEEFIRQSVLYEKVLKVVQDNAVIKE